MSRGSRQFFDMEQTVRLLGDLGERYGVEHTYYNLRTPADAIKLLCINKPEFQEELIHAHENGVGYRLIQAGTDLDYADLQLPLGSNDLILTPVVTGSGGGAGKVLAGIGLVALAIVTAGAGAGFLGLGAGLTAGTFTLGAAASTAIGAIGASLVLGGVSQMLSPQPTIPTPGSFGGANRLSSGENLSTDGPQSVVRGSDGRQSYVYTGAANTVGVGAVIPVAYGTALVGSHLLSARVDVSDDSDPLKTAIREPGEQTVLVGGETIAGITYAGGLRTRKWSPSKIRGFNPAHRRYLSLENGNSVQLRQVDPKEDTRADNYMVFFELDLGLFDYVSGEGSTLVDAFITYKIETTATPEGGGDDERFVSSSIQSTIQGLLLRTQNYKWMHYISYAKLDGAEHMQTTVSIVDFRAAGGRLKIVNNCYNGFNNSSSNKVPVT